MTRLGEGSLLGAAPFSLQPKTNVSWFLQVVQGEKYLHWRSREEAVVSKEEVVPGDFVDEFIAKDGHVQRDMQPDNWMVCSAALLTSRQSCLNDIRIATIFTLSCMWLCEFVYVSIYLWGIMFSCVCAHSPETNDWLLWTVITGFSSASNLCAI